MNKTIEQRIKILEKTLGIKEEQSLDSRKIFLDLIKTNAFKKFKNENFWTPPNESFDTYVSQDLGGYLFKIRFQMISPEKFLMVSWSLLEIESEEIEEKSSIKVSLEDYEVSDLESLLSKIYLIYSKFKNKFKSNINKF